MTAEDLGEHALRAATQSGYAPVDCNAHGIGALAMTDAPLRSELYDEPSEDNLWAETFALAVEFGVWVEESAGEPFEWEQASEAMWSRDIDLHQAKVVEASLFDPGSQETVQETRKPRIFADDDSPEHTQVIHSGKRQRAARAASSR
jgi:hypothetical protein